MTKSVIALYDDMHHARQCVNDLIDHGFDRERISLLASDSEGKYKRYFESSTDEEEVISDAGKGAGIGAVLGGLAGLVVGLGALAIPGIGPIIAAGPIATTLAGAGIGAATGGLVGALTNLGIPEDQANLYAEGIRHGGILVSVEVPDSRVDEAIRIMNMHNPIDTNERRQEWMMGTQARSTTPLTGQRRETEHETFEVVEEDLQVGKREVDKGAVRVSKTVSERPVEADLNLRDEHVEVERRKVDRPATPGDMAFREQTIEIHEKSEKPVVHKDARVVEEVDVHKEVDERKETIRDTVRRTDVNVERTDDTYDDFDPIWRSHFQTTYSGTGSSYDDFAPAYRYGYEMYSSDRYHDRRWDEIEREIRMGFERRYPGQRWDEYREAVRQGFMASLSRR